MSFKYNPFTGELDIAGAGGGGTGNLKSDGSVPMDDGYVPLATGQDIATVGIATILLPDSYTVVVGDQVTDATNNFKYFLLRNQQGYLQVSDSNPPKDCEIIFTFKNATDFSNLIYYLNPNKPIGLFVWNYNTLVWDTIGITPPAVGPVSVQLTGDANWTSNGERKIRFIAYNGSLVIGTVHLQRATWDRVWPGDAALIPFANTFASQCSTNYGEPIALRSFVKANVPIPILGSVFYATHSLVFGSVVSGDVGGVLYPYERFNETPPNQSLILAPDAVNGLEFIIVFDGRNLLSLLNNGLPASPVLIAYTSTVGTVTVAHSDDSGSTWYDFGNTLPTSDYRSILSPGLLVADDFTFGGIYVPDGEIWLRFTCAGLTGQFELEFIGFTQYPSYTGLEVLPHQRLIGFEFPSHPESALIISDNTINNATASKHGFLPKLSGSSSDVFKGDGSYGGVPSHFHDENALQFNDVTTADADVTQHGLLPKLSGNANDVLKGDGTWGGGGGGGQVFTFDAEWVVNGSPILVIDCNGTLTLTATDLITYQQWIPNGNAHDTDDDLEDWLIEGVRVEAVRDVSNNLIRLFCTADNIDEASDGSSYGIRVYVHK
jgi:hypothetical protein